MPCHVMARGGSGSEISSGEQCELAPHPSGRYCPAWTNRIRKYSHSAWLLVVMGVQAIRRRGWRSAGPCG